jgi:molecular chaperone DnaJ
MATRRDYYEVLGVSRDVDEKELKRAYRKIAMDNHPDRNPGNAEAEERFKAAAEAYSVLSDTEKRAKYDRFGHEAFAGGGGGAGFDPNDVFSNFGDIFSELFGGGGFGGARRNPNAPSAGEDLQMTLRVPFDFAVHGGQTPVTVPRTHTCDTCSGTGAKEGSSPKTCGQCNGNGVMLLQQGLFRVQTTCNRCRGQGTVIEDKCGTCNGQGSVRKTEEVVVKVPAGVDSGMRLRIVGKGNAGRKGGPSGNLYIVLDVAQSELFERDGADILMPYTVDFTQAALGAEVEIPTIDGKTTIKIKPGTQHGDRTRIAGAGLQYINRKNRGDFHVEFRIEVPRDLNARQRELLTELAEVNQVKVKQRHEGLFNRLFSFFSNDDSAASGE